MTKKYFAAAGFALLLSTAGAYAVPITTPPPILSAVGDVKAVFAFADAGDTSILNEVTPLSINQIFCNHSTGGCTAASPGATVDLGIQAGAMVFSLNDITTGRTFFSNAPDADGNYHALITSNFAAFGVGALPSGASTAIAALIASGNSITYVGFEDHQLGDPTGADFDYNDLIFAFANTVVAPPVGVPEPLTISLFGAGIIGAGWLSRRRKIRHS
ncbi:MAG TPA: PEP-CTERM sorting domain-containing protein [Rhizomicrobium sp.]|nr:PEP-CTERM sorting domain-containing protein [Rhizomicrobium sp.]